MRNRILQAIRKTRSDISFIDADIAQCQKEIQNKQTDIDRHNEEGRALHLQGVKLQENVIKLNNNKLELLGQIVGMEQLLGMDGNPDTENG